MIVWLRRFLRFIFLRGALLEFWARRKSRLLEQGFLAEIAQVKCGEQKFEDQPKPFPTPLRRILFLGDCMWENEQLIPELEKIAPTSVLDLAPALRASKISDPTIEEAKVTLQVLERYTSQSSENFDLILLYARPSLLSEDIFTMLREKWSCPVFGLNLDDKSHFFPLGIYSRQIDNYRQWVRYFDLNLSSTRAASDWYAQADAPYYFLAFISPKSL